MRNRIKSFFKKIENTSEKLTINTDFRSKKKIKITQTSNILKLEILENCTKVEIYQELAETLSREKMVILKTLIQENLKAQTTFYYLEIGDVMYSIQKSWPDLEIIESTKGKRKERRIVIDQYKKIYQLFSTTYDDEGKVLKEKKYDSQKLSKENEFKIRKELKEEARTILVRLTTFKELATELEVRNVYHDLNLLQEKEYVPIISNGTISLSPKFIHIIKDMKKDRMQSFNIILEETKEIVGEISYNYITDAGFSYGGNTSYEIKTPFRKNHYATEALSLLKKLLIENEFEGDKDLYIAVRPENEYSKKVAQNNGGFLVYEGAVPEGELIRSLDQVKEVKVYKIKMNRNQN